MGTVNRESEGRWKDAGKLRTLVRLRGYPSYSQAAKAAGMHPIPFRRLVRGQHIPKLGTLDRLLAAFAIDYESFVRLAPTQEPLNRWGKRRGRADDATAV